MNTGQYWERLPGRDGLNSVVREIATDVVEQTNREEIERAGMPSATGSDRQRQPTPL